MQTISSINQAIELIIDNTPDDIHLGTPLGLGKPHLLLNALYEKISNTASKKLTIYTALSLNPPTGKSDLEQRFLKPFVSRVYGDDFPRLAYADALVSDSLPDNIRVESFYMQSGALLGSLSAQTSYASLNYTSVPEALATRGVNLMAQRVAMRVDDAGKKQYSLSCNTDLSMDTLKAIAETGADKPFCVAEVDPQLPWVGGSAIVPDDWFDVVIEHTQPQGNLFVLPRQPVGDVDYAVGFYASTLVKDGGTLQIGIGALADALCHALVLRHTNNTAYRAVLKSLNANIENHPTVKKHGGLEPFEIGLYGCSEMINEGFRLLVEHGILRRQVVENTNLMKKVNEGRATKRDLSKVAREGQFLHGAFYLGSADFYQWVNSLADTKNTLGMQSVSMVNSVAGEHFALEKAQRQQARFFNTCMMATMLGGAASDTLPDGRVVSGVGGQYNFVAMGHTLPKACSVLMLRASRSQAGKTTSNIRWAVENLTVPRHLRDVYITEYGIADLRNKTDADCITTMLSVTEGAFVDALLDKAIACKKLPKSAKTDGQNQRHITKNTACLLAHKLKRFRADGTLPDYPLGSDFTQVEQHVVKALKWLKQNTQAKSLLAKATAHSVPNVLDVLKNDLFNTALADVELLKSITQKHKKQGDKRAKNIKLAMQRMGFDAPAGVKETMMAKLFWLALVSTCD